MALDGSAQSSSLSPEQSRVVALATQCFQQASAFFAKDLALPEIRFDIRGACAGQAVFLRTGRREETRIRFNPQLLRQDPEEFFGQVVAHECAHVIARRIYGRRIKPHGDEWRYVMQEVLGVEPKVRHTMDVAHLPRRRHLYLCGCQERQHALSSVRHNRIQSGQQVYLCRECRQPLSPAPAASDPV